MPKTSTGAPDDMGKWLALAGALASVGILPKGWQKAIGVAGAVLVIIKMLDK